MYISSENHTNMLSLLLSNENLSTNFLFTIYQIISQQRVSLLVNCVSREKSNRR